MLLKIRNYIRREQVVSVQQLAREFHLDEQALQPMLDLWEKKGAISPCQEDLACQKSCFSCKINKAVFYRSNH